MASKDVIANEAPKALKFKTSSLEDTASIARKIAPLARPTDIILLKGDLGSGKSVFARAFIQVLCGKSVDVPSPTFTLVQTYTSPSYEIWHFDLYRLNGFEEVYELGIEEAYETGVSLIEWPERLGNNVPPRALRIEFKYGTHECERILCLTGWKDRFF